LSHNSDTDTQISSGHLLPARWLLLFIILPLHSFNYHQLAPVQVFNKQYSCTGKFHSLCNIYDYYPVDISTTVFSYSRAVQYHVILQGCYLLLHGPWGYAVS